MREFEETMGIQLPLKNSIRILEGAEILWQVGVLKKHKEKY